MINRYFIIYKPVDMVSQFVSPHKVNLLGDLEFDFPEGTYAVGRLDNHSEGLLILTNNKKIQRLLFSEKESHERKYLVLAKNKVSAKKLDQLRNGVPLKVANGEDYTTLPCHVEIVERPKNLHKGMFDYDEAVPHAWLTITLKEGKFHQVRKMFASVGNHVRRLIRVSIDDLEIGDLKPGEVREIEEEELFRKLKLAIE